MQDRHRSTYRIIEIVPIGSKEDVDVCNLLWRGRHTAPPASSATVDDSPRKGARSSAAPHAVRAHRELGAVDGSFG